MPIRIALGLAGFWLALAAPAHASVYSLGEPMDCDIGAAAGADPDRIHVPEPDVSADGAPLYAAGDPVVATLERSIGRPAPRGSHIALGQAVFDPVSGRLTIAGRDFGPAPIDCGQGEQRD